MKREYQKKASPERVTSPGEAAVQIDLPMAEVLASLEQGLGELVRRVGRLFIESILEAEVEQIAGPRSSRRETRQAYRWERILPDRWPTCSHCPTAGAPMRRQGTAFGT